MASKLQKECQKKEKPQLEPKKKWEQRISLKK